MKGKGKSIVLYSSTVALVLAALYSWLELTLHSLEEVSLDETNDDTALVGEQKLSIPSEGAYLGAFAGFGPYEETVTEAGINEFNEMIGKKIAWAYFSDNWFDGIHFPSESVEVIKSMDITPYIRIMPRTDFRIKPMDSPYTLKRISDGEYDDELREWARSAKASNVPIILEFGTEVNGDWFPWNGGWNGEEYLKDNNEVGHTGAGLFKETYRHIIELFREEEVSNVTWVYHVNAISSPEEEWNGLDKYFPGDEYIDWIGVSVYGAQSVGEYWEEFDEVYAPAYEKIKSFTDKPIAIVEMGVSEGTRKGLKSQWIARALRSLKDGTYPDTKGVSYWHSSWEDSGVIHDLRIDSSESAKATFREEVEDEHFLSEASFGTN